MYSTLYYGIKSLKRLENLGAKLERCLLKVKEIYIYINKKKTITLS